MILSVHGEHVEAFHAHARFTAPDECCGLLAFGTPDRLRFVYCLTNTDASAHRFTIDPTEHFRALQHAERNGWEIAGTFHSHPGGSPSLSATDVELLGESPWIHVVVAGEPDDIGAVRAYAIRDGSARDVPVTIR